MVEALSLDVKEAVFLLVFAVGITCSYISGRTYGMTIGGTVGMNLMKEFFKTRLGADKVEELCDQGPWNFENWLVKLSKDKS